MLFRSATGGDHGIGFKTREPQNDSQSVVSGLVDSALLGDMLEKKKNLVAIQDTLSQKL